MSIYTYSNLYNNLENLPQAIRSQITNGKIIPVIGEGNCAFRSIIQSLLINSATNLNKKEALIAYLRKLYFVNKDAVIMEHARLNRRDRDISFDEFADFIGEFGNLQQVSANNNSLELFLKDYFPLQLNGDQRTHLPPAKDKMIKFLACCLRKEIVGYQLSKQATDVEYMRHVTTADLREDNFFTLDEQVVGYFKEQDIDLFIYENDPLVTIGEPAAVPNTLTANVIFDRGQPNAHNQFNNGHYHALLSETSSNELCPHPIPTQEQNIQQATQFLRAYSRYTRQQRTAAAERLAREKRDLKLAERLQAEEDHILAETLQQEEYLALEQSQPEMPSEVPPEPPIMPMGTAAQPILNSFRSIMSITNSLGYFAIPVLCGVIACSYLAKRFRN